MKRSQFQRTCSGHICILDSKTMENKILKILSIFKYFTFTKIMDIHLPDLPHTRGSQLFSSHNSKFRQFFSPVTSHPRVLCWWCLKESLVTSAYQRIPGVGRGGFATLPLPLSFLLLRGEVLHSFLLISLWLSGMGKWEFQSPSLPKSSSWLWKSK